MNDREKELENAWTFRRSAESDRKTRVETRIVITGEASLVEARQHGRAMAATTGFDAADQVVIATAISEVARNILTYAGRGEIILRITYSQGRHGITIVAQDDGPGIPDIALAMRDGYSTSGSFGVGLPGLKRLVDEFAVKSSEGHGTIVTMTKWTAA